MIEQAVGFTPLHVASQVGNVGIVSMLLEAGANKEAATVCAVIRSEYHGRFYLNCNFTCSLVFFCHAQ